ncbi:autophagy-related protein 13-like isoform X2 [Ylistrum balloti]|uniref:autophagy-related protein 13-like isoform X2 n=1 Tax=Ylistrum balloti TaxID=509963 RepID=UPI0029058740|nr:autophagy-related protein 13-like isoform X2 [Ylistrum balloti]
MSSRLNAQDKKDLEKFTKFLIFKSLQVIVQSRLGEKIRTKSKPISSGTDWFNLAIKDIPDVHSEAKRALANQQPILGQNVCVEISLKTSEGATMVLETWYISLDPDHCDNNVKISYTVYNRMGTALKSLFTVSRVTPAYKLSRRQGVCSDDYVICYRIYAGDPQFFMLGDGYQTAKVGTVPTPQGTISIQLAYRTKLLITPQKTSKEVGFEVKDDHFKKDNSPKRPTTPKPCSMGYRRESVVDDCGQAYDDTQDLCSTTFTASPTDGFLYNAMQTGSLPRTYSQPIRIDGRLPNSQNGEEFKPTSAPEKQASFSNFHKVGAFAQPKTKDYKSDVDEVPFLNLLQPAPLAKFDIEDLSGDSKSTTLKSSSTADQMDGMSRSASKDSSSSQTSAPDDFVMVELTPFAGADPNTDLGKFYRDCQGAPMLESFNEEKNVTDTLEMISSQLVIFETDMKDFDAFMTSITESSHDGL